MLKKRIIFDYKEHGTEKKQCKISEARKYLPKNTPLNLIRSRDDGTIAIRGITIVRSCGDIINISDYGYKKPQGPDNYNATNFIWYEKPF